MTYSHCFTHLTPIFYNRGVPKSLLIAAAAMASMLIVSCSRDIQNSEAVKQGVLNYLNERKDQIGLDTNQMQIDVGAVSFQKNEARASVIFRPKNSPDPAPMTITYVLDRKGDKWVVRPRAEGGASPHGGAGGSSMPPNHPGVGDNPQAPGGPGSMPAGHPSVNPDSGSKK